MPILRLTFPLLFVMTAHFRSQLVPHYLIPRLPRCPLETIPSSQGVLLLDPPPVPSLQEDFSRRLEERRALSEIVTKCLCYQREISSSQFVHRLRQPSQGQQNWVPLLSLEGRDPLTRQSELLAF